MVVPVNNIGSPPVFPYTYNYNSTAAEQGFSVDQIIPTQPDIATDNNTEQQDQTIFQEALITTPLENELFAQQLSGNNVGNPPDITADDNTDAEQQDQTIFQDALITTPLENELFGEQTVSGASSAADANNLVNNVNIEIDSLVSNLSAAPVAASATNLKNTSGVATSENLTPAEQMEKEAQQFITQLYQQIAALELTESSTAPNEQLGVFGVFGASLLPGLGNYAGTLAPDGEVSQVENNFITDTAPIVTSTKASTGSAANDNRAAQTTAIYSAANNNQIAAASPKNWVVA